MKRPFYKKKRFLIPIIILTICIGFLIFFKIAVILNPPEVTDKSALNLKREKIAQNFYTCSDSWLKKNEYGLWELYIEGNDFELGVKNGILTRELIEYQEEAFVAQIKQMIPSESYLSFLKYFISWFNKDIDEHIPLEYQREIYGVSYSASNEYEFIAPNYHRILNYHAAHDIGHTLQNLNLVACTAFGVRNSRSEDSTLLIGRNMDFYSGDKFADNKIIAFYQPENGCSFAFITWGGLIGVLSGMNDQGLTVTLNSAKSSIPTVAKTPVSILARKILQYATTIDEAYKIAKEYETFVAESFLIGSAKDNNIAIIEKSPDTIGIYMQNENQIILTNHFQSETFKNSELTLQNKKESCSVYRWQRTEELLNRTDKHNVNSFAKILRDQKGKGDKNIGMGNEMAINQLIAHHSVIFKPAKLQIWISTSPFQLGEYIAYDLKSIFSESFDCHNTVLDTSLIITADTFLKSQDYDRFVKFKKRTVQIKNKLKQESIKPFANDYINEYIKFNPEYFYTYYIIGEYYAKLNKKEKAIEYYNKALEKEIPRKVEVNLIKEKVRELRTKPTG